MVKKNVFIDVSVDSNEDALEVEPSPASSEPLPT